MIEQNESKATDYNSWPLDLLADYIEKKHHRYVESRILEIKPFLHKVATVHGGRHPELIEVAELFDQTSDELTVHMKKEEFVLFPFIRKMVSQKAANQPISTPPFGTVQNPIEMMKHDHNAEGALSKITEPDRQLRATGRCLQNLYRYVCHAEGICRRFIHAHSFGKQHTLSKGH